MGSSHASVPNTEAQLMVVIEGKQKEAAATEEVVSKATKHGDLMSENGGYFVPVEIIVFLF